MKLPNAELAYIQPEKITDYLLNPEHPANNGKADFYMSRGFSVVEWTALRDVLIQHGREHSVKRIMETPFGPRYIVEGEAMMPNGTIKEIRAVWQATSEEDSAPWLVTAYPL